MSTTAPSSPPLPFRLSHLELNARKHIHQEILVGLLEGSSGKLTTLTLHHMGGIPDPVASIADVLSRTSFAHLRRLNIDSNNFITYTSVLPLLPALEDLTLRIGAGVPRGGLRVYRVFSAVANACGPTLLALDVQHTRKSPTRGSTSGTSPNPSNLRGSRISASCIFPSGFVSTRSSRSGRGGRSPRTSRRSARERSRRGGTILGEYVKRGLSNSCSGAGTTKPGKVRPVSLSVLAFADSC